MGIVTNKTHDGNKFRIGIFYYSQESVPVLSGWPWFQIEFDSQGVHIGPSLKVWPHYCAKPFLWTDLLRVERSRRGIRFHFKNKDRRQLQIWTPTARNTLEDELLRYVPDIWDPTVRTYGYWQP